MSIQPSNLATEWTEETFAAQQRQWRYITGISTAINDAAAEEDWNALLALADERQVLIADFFKQEICVPLFKQIMVDLDQIRVQHEAVIQLVNQGLVRNSAREAELKAVRANVPTYFEHDTTEGDPSNESKHS